MLNIFGQGCITLFVFTVGVKKERDNRKMWDWDW